MEYTPIKTEDAIDAVLKGETLERREIPDLRALIEGIRGRASDSDRTSLNCQGCRILECECKELQIPFQVAFFGATFSENAAFYDATFTEYAAFDCATFAEKADFRKTEFLGKTDFDRVTFGKGADFHQVEFREHANFSEAKFADIVDFRFARFSEDANFSRATFTGKIFFARAEFEKSEDFRFTTFAEEAFFSAATFTLDAGFIEAVFMKPVDFSHTSFGGAAAFTETTFLKAANFRGATFARDAGFEGASFSEDTVLVGNLASANFTRATFRGCQLQGNDGSVANLEGANLEHSNGLILDSTPIRGARFSPRASDPWSQLRRAYTGPRLVFTLMFLAAFFTPYVLKTAGWVGVNRVQEELKQDIEEVSTRVKALESEEHAVAQPLTVALEAVADQLPNDKDGLWQTRSVWELVIGMDKKWTYWVTAIVLLAYNVCRAVLTWFVAPMRDAEERSGVSPAYRIDMSNVPKIGHGWEVATWPVRWLRWWWGTLTDSYHWLILPHRFVQVVFVLAVLSFCLHAVDWLQLPVTLPAEPTVPD